MKIIAKNDEIHATSQIFQNFQFCRKNIKIYWICWNSEFGAVRRSVLVDLLDLEKYENNALDAKVGVDTAENEPKMFMTYAMGISISYLQARYRCFQNFSTRSRCFCKKRNTYVRILMRLCYDIIGRWTHARGDPLRDEEKQRRQLVLKTRRGEFRSVFRNEAAQIAVIKYPFESDWPDLQIPRSSRDLNFQNVTKFSKFRPQTGEVLRALPNTQCSSGAQVLPSATVHKSLARSSHKFSLLFQDAARLHRFLRGFSIFFYRQEETT